jgi:iron-sulfur cluster repair protein YtfE (RIC family)
MKTGTRIDPTMTINEVIAQHPATIAVFNHLGMDTCCGGGVSVSDAAHRESLDVTSVLSALREAIEHS